MAWIRQVPIEAATGLLKAEFEKALQRAGRIWNIVHVMSVNPRVLRDNLRLYVTIMMGQSPLSRVQREMLATVVSTALKCVY